MGTLTFVAVRGEPCAQRSFFVRHFSWRTQCFVSSAFESISHRPCPAAFTSSAKAPLQILSNSALKGRPQQFHVNEVTARRAVLAPMEARRC